MFSDLQRFECFGWNIEKILTSLSLFDLRRERTRWKGKIATFPSLNRNGFLLTSGVSKYLKEDHRLRASSLIVLLNRDLFLSDRVIFRKLDAPDLCDLNCTLLIENLHLIFHLFYSCTRCILSTFWFTRFLSHRKADVGFVRQIINWNLHWYWLCCKWNSKE